MVTTAIPADGAGTRAWSGLLAGVRLLPVLLQLGLAGLVIWQFHLESRSFFKVFALAVAAFPVHAVLPLRYRMPFFTAVSLAAIAVVFGIRDGAFLVGAGLSLILACHVPVRFAIRVALVVSLGAFFGVVRAGAVALPIPAVVWPILASMFMFRLALYLHALRHDPTPASPVKTLAYFFMLPNVCYPLFPVVDYATFGRTYYAAPDLSIYERGARWIIRGLVHLLLYRLVYLHLVMDPAQVVDLSDVLQFVVSTFLLYLRVSGQFHLIVGILHLFGFGLPETHRFYYLASSFTDLWRRINIYWKDFIMKLVFYPSFFRLRKRGERFALVSATIVAFLATWMLHSYQWFWLRGGFPLTFQDGIFWIVLGGLVIENSLRERRRGRQRSLTGPPQRWSAGRALRVAGVFTTMCVIWSMWSSESLTDWLTVWSAATNVDAPDLLLLFALLTGGLLVAGWTWDRPVAVAEPASTNHVATLRGIALLAGLLVIGQPAVHERGGERLASLVGSLQSPALNELDTELQHRGYYEGLDESGRLSAELWQVQMAAPAGWAAIQDTEAYERRSDFALVGLHADVHEVNVKGAPFSTNRWGMRDRDYTTEKPPGTIRIALLGPSHTAGAGVPDGATFEAVLEERLNATAEAGIRYEVLNFSIPRQTFVQQLYHLETRVRPFDPDVVMITATGRTYHDPPMTRYLTTVLRRGIEIPYDELEEIIESAGIHAADLDPEGRPIPSGLARRTARRLGVRTRLPDAELRLRLGSVMDDITGWAMQRMYETIVSMDAVPVVLGLDLVGMEEDEAPAIELAAETGFVVFDLLDVYAEYDRAEMQLGAWDNHPNSTANRIIAERLYRELGQSEVIRRLRPKSAGR